jgi:DNA-binding IclR family transcriptional regulator
VSQPAHPTAFRPAEDSATRDIQAVERVALILDLFDHRTIELSAAEAAARLGLKRTTVQRYFSSMLAVRLLERGTASGTYTPGRLLAQLGALAIGRRRVIEFSIPHMRELSARTHMTTVLSLWGTAGPVVMRVEEDLASAGLVAVRVGSRLPILSAQAITFLAFLPDAARVHEALERLPARARTRVRALIESARSTGVTTYVSEETGIGGVAAPIFDATGICATLALLGTLVTTSSEQHPERPEQVATVAQAITCEMGGERFSPFRQP